MFINNNFKFCFYAYEKYYPQTFLEEYEIYESIWEKSMQVYERKNVKTKNYIDMELESGSDSNSDNDINIDNDNEE